MKKEMISFLTIFLASFIFIGIFLTSGISQGQTLKIEKCDASEPLKNSECLKEQQSKLDTYITELIQKLKNESKSEWGDEADKEMAERLDLSQKSWTLYRHNQCFLFYYSKASTHPPSVGERMSRCKLAKTLERASELENLIKKEN